MRWVQCERARLAAGERQWGGCRERYGLRLWQESCQRLSPPHRTCAAIIARACHATRCPTENAPSDVLIVITRYDREVEYRRQEHCRRHAHATATSAGALRRSCIRRRFVDDAAAHAYRHVCHGRYGKVVARYEPPPASVVYASYGRKA